MAQETYGSRVLPALAALSLIAVSGFAASAKLVSKEQTCDGIRFRVTVPRLVLDGEAVWVRIEIINESREPCVTLLEHLAYSAFQFELTQEARLPGGEFGWVPVKRTDFGKRCEMSSKGGPAGRNIWRPVVPGYRLVYRLSLSKLFQLDDGGIYRLSVRPSLLRWPTPGRRAPLYVKDVAFRFILTEPICHYENAKGKRIGEVEYLDQKAYPRIHAWEKAHHVK